MPSSSLHLRPGRRRHTARGSLAALVCAIGLLAAGAPAAEAAQPTIRDLVPAGRLSPTADLVRDAGGAIVSASPVDRTITRVSPTGAVLSMASVPFAPSALVAMPDGTVVALSPADRGPAEAARVDPSGDVERLAVPPATTDLAVDQARALIAVTSEGQILRRGVGDGDFSVVADTGGRLRSAVVTSSGSIAACGEDGLWWSTASSTTRLSPPSVGCLAAAASVTDTVVAAATDGSIVEYGADGASSRLGTATGAAVNRIGLLADGDVLYAAGGVLTRLHPDTGWAGVIAAGSTTAGIGAPRAGFLAPFVVSSEGVYVMRQVADSTAALDRVSPSDAERSTFVGYPSIPTIPYRAGLVRILPQWTGTVLDPQFRIVSGSLPPGMWMDPRTGIITGPPDARGVFTATVALTSPAGTPSPTTTVTITTLGPTRGVY